MSEREETQLAQLQASARDALVAGQIDRTLELARQGLAAAPDDPICLELVGIAYCQSQRPAKGIRYLRRVLDLSGAHGAASINLANALLSTGQPEEARVWLEKAVASEPDNADALTLLANIARQKQDFETAEAHLLQALQTSPAHPAALNTLATQYAQSGQTHRACELFQRAVAAQPELAALHLNLAHTLHQAGRLEEAESALQNAIRLEADLVEAHLLLTAVLQAKGQHAAALESAATACRLRPDDPHARYLYCDLLERTHQLDKAMTSLKEGLAYQPQNVHFNLVLARCERRTQALQPALMRLDAAVSQPMDHLTAQAVHAERGMTLDLLENFDEAFEAFTRANEHGATVWQQMNSNQAPFVEAVQRLQARFTPQWVASWSPLQPPDEKTTPVFLMSFPRSGTTLLNRMLAMHTHLQAVEEIDAINHLSSILQAHLGGYPDGLAQLDDHNASKLRAAYYQVFRDVAAIDTTAGKLVDKMPINTVDVGLINRLFPKARIIFVQRNPADVCLSCFMQPFQPNALNAQFLTLEDTARCYREVMQLWERYQSVLNLRVHTVQYEALVAQPEQTLQSLCTFLELAWEPAMLDFQSQAREVKTASYQQVASPLYTTASGRAQRYAKHLAPLTDLIATSL